MSKNGDTLFNNLFSSIISDIESYSGNDPILPWIRGIRKMKEALPNELLKEKLPRFLEKCSMTFLTDRRYSNDLRYLRIWLQLMDFVDDPKLVLRKMEKNHIGAKKSLFYQAYALYYEKKKKFDAAEKIYHVGVQNLAEPADELQKSYEQFLHRMERHKKKRGQHQEGKSNSTSFSAKGVLLNHEKVKCCNENSLRTEGQAAVPLHRENRMDPSQRPEKEMAAKDANHKQKERILNKLNDQLLRKVKEEHNENKRICSDDTVVFKFVDTAIVGKSKTEDARHHGLVEPTINTKDALNDINNMFREPLEPPVSARRLSRKQTRMNSSLNVFTEESLENFGPSYQSNDPSSVQPSKSGTNRPLDESLEIFICCDQTSGKDIVNEKSIQPQTSISRANGSVFAKPNNHSENLKDQNPRRAAHSGFREDTVVYRFVGSTISDEPEVENVWHHGLVEPTVNMKEAMNDINSMFGKPIEYARKSRQRKQDKEPLAKNNCGEFLILPDDETDTPKAEGDNNCVFQKPLTSGIQNTLGKQDAMPDAINKDSGFLILPDDELDFQEDRSVPSSFTEKGSDLFEQTLCTKEAMAEINKLFAMPMDF